MVGFLGLFGKKKEASKDLSFDLELPALTENDVSKNELKPLDTSIPLMNENTSEPNNSLPSKTLNSEEDMQLPELAMPSNKTEDNLAPIMPATNTDKDDSDSKSMQAVNPLENSNISKIQDSTEEIMDKEKLSNAIENSLSNDADANNKSFSDDDKDVVKTNESVPIQKTDDISINLDKTNTENKKDLENDIKSKPEIKEMPKEEKFINDSEIDDQSDKENYNDLFKGLPDFNEDEISSSNFNLDDYNVELPSNYTNNSKNIVADEDLFIGKDNYVLTLHKVNDVKTELEKNSTKVNNLVSLNTKAIKSFKKINDLLEGSHEQLILIEDKLSR